MINETTLITGSTDGIGKQIGIDLLDKNHHVIFTGKSEEHIKKLETYLCSHQYENFETVWIDFSYDSAIVDLLYIVESENIVIDNLVLNVGYTCREKFPDITMEEWNKTLFTNLTYPLFLIKNLLPYIQKRIIFIGSVTGHIPNATSIAYGVSKGALEILTQYLARDLAKEKITVNTVAPGFIWTKWHQAKSPDQLKRIKSQNLLKRFGTTQEVSKVVQFIIENDYVNGQTICVDGGFHLE